MGVEGVRGWKGCGGGVGDSKSLNKEERRHK